MANSDNQCSDLKVEDHYKNTKDTFGMIYNKQKELQERLGMNYKDLTLKEIAEMWMVNKHAMSDELNEMFDALGGINDGIGSAAWKYWKQDNKKASKKAQAQMGAAGSVTPRQATPRLSDSSWATDAHQLSHFFPTSNEPESMEVVLPTGRLDVTFAPESSPPSGVG